MGKGRRYSRERRINVKKIAGCVIVLVALILFIITINKLLNSDMNDTTKGVEVSYHLVYQDNKWGVIDSLGNIVINPTYNEIIQIPDSKTPVFICTYDVDYSNNTYKTKVLNDENQEILKEYNLVTALNNFNDKEYWCEDNVLRFKREDKFGLLDYTGKVILQPEYDNIIPMQGYRNKLIITKDSKIGICNNSGKILVEVGEYQEFRKSDIENAFIFKKDDKYGIIKTDGEIVLENEYADIKQFSILDLFIVKQDNKWKIYNKENVEILANKYDDFYGVENNNVIVKKGNKYGVVAVTANTSTPIEVKYDDIIYTFNDNYIVKLDDKYGIINAEGEIKVEIKYKNITYREEINCLECELDGQTDKEIYNKNLENVANGVIFTINVDKAYIKIKEGNEYKYYNLEFESKTNIQALSGNTIFSVKDDDKYGFVNKNEEQVIDTIYDNVTEQNKFGFAGIKKDGLWGVINSEGKVIVEPKYDLDDTSVNFIDKWYEVVNDKLVYFTM